MLNSLKLDDEIEGKERKIKRVRIEEKRDEIREEKIKRGIGSRKIIIVEIGIEKIKEGNKIGFRNYIIIIFREVKVKIENDINY